MRASAAAASSAWAKPRRTASFVRDVLSNFAPQPESVPINWLALLRELGLQTEHEEPDSRESRYVTAAVAE
ncbi:hypothetical protein BH20VER2_BH20VER2_11510 [soil metagenome]|nr:hypothetical protein [Chthoniobacterales bacterium]